MVYLFGRIGDMTAPCVDSGAGDKKDEHQGRGSLELKIILTYEIIKTHN